ncbi:MAG TPA: histidine phosphatase family protein [Methylothermaceae bacterium]|nr:histidine phosphatase family protein [Methylothermaceae bacterium]
MSEKHELGLLRHAKSAWNTDAPTDFDRPLNERGKRDAPRMGKWMAAQDWVPDTIIASPARRAKQTVKRVCRELGFPLEQISWEERIYNADVSDLLAVLRECPETSRKVLLVGHNPGLSDLLELLTGSISDGALKLLPTAALARLEVDGAWKDLGPGKGRLIGITRPKELRE